MGPWPSKSVIVVVLALLASVQLAVGLRITIDRDECFSHKVQYEGDVVHASFVVIKAEAPWHYGDEVLILWLRDHMVNRFMMLVIRRVTSLSLWLTTKVFISSASLTSLLIMRL
ncbi:hypothetical protein Scep_028995 [Stephania cephalantha]|uniref:Uncharacterized protein n=1 Tax=Stephania cephalantha TaxID=152367 RepID=A0AAP0EF67_9MAGN